MAARASIAIMHPERARQVPEREATHVAAANVAGTAAHRSRGFASVCRIYQRGSPRPDAQERFADDFVCV